jgi:dTDP-4-amino-4,6-dideoxygalactose transaminase
MYEGGLHCVSFQIKKRVPIGRGGMILLDDKEDYEYLKKIRYDGRDLDGPYDDDPFEHLGWHYYMTPEDAARGIILMDQVPEVNEDYAGWESYPDVSKARFLQK